MASPPAGRSRWLGTDPVYCDAPPKPSNGSRRGEHYPQLPQANLVPGRVSGLEANERLEPPKHFAPVGSFLLPVKVITRDDCDVLAVSASLVNPSTGQTLLATAQTPKVEAGREQNLTLRWNMHPSQANETLARENVRKSQIETLGDHQGNSSLRDLAVAHVSTKLIPAPPAWQSVTIQEIRCL